MLEEDVTWAPLSHNDFRALAVREMTEIGNAVQYGTGFDPHVLPCRDTTRTARTS